MRNPLPKPSIAPTEEAARERERGERSHVQERPSDLVVPEAEPSPERRLLPRRRGAAQATGRAPSVQAVRLDRREDLAPPVRLAPGQGEAFAAMEERVHHCVRSVADQGGAEAACDWRASSSKVGWDLAFWVGRMGVHYGGTRWCHALDSFWSIHD